MKTSLFSIIQQDMVVEVQFSDLGDQLSYEDLNNVIFTNCTWRENVAKFSTAVDVSPNVYDNIVGGFHWSLLSF